MKRINFFIAGLVAVVALQFVAFVLALATELNYVESLRIVFGSVFVLFLPGWVWSFVFFPARRERRGYVQVREERRVDLIERIALSFALSIAVVPLAVFYLNLIGMKISAWSSFFVVAGLILVGAAVVWFRGRRSKV